MPTQGAPTLDAIQERVGALERAVLAPPPEPSRHRSGIRVSDWFLPTDLAWRLVLAPGAARAGLGPLLAFGRGRLARALATRRRHAWRLGADALAINKNYRLFYLGEELTVKAHFPAADGDDPIMREVAVRRAVTSTDAIRLPEMLHHGRSTGASYIAERLIPNAGKIDPEQGAERLAGALFGFYAANGMTVRPLAEAAASGLWREDVAEALSAAGLAPAAIGAVRQSMERLLEEAAARPVLWGLCHGDLSLGNMLRAGDRIYLLDWEEACEGPIYGDLAKLIAAVPGFEARFDALTRDLCGADAPIAAQKRLADVTLLRRLWRESRSGDARPAKQRRLAAAARRLVAGCAPEAG